MTNYVNCRLVIYKYKNEYMYVLKLVTNCVVCMQHCTNNKITLSPIFTKSYNPYANSNKFTDYYACLNIA